MSDTAIPCSRGGCTSGLPAIWFPVLLVYAFPQHRPCRAVIDLPHCNPCRNAAYLGDLLTTGGFIALSALLVAKGFARPDRDLLRLDWETRAEDAPATPAGVPWRPLYSLTAYPSGRLPLAKPKLSVGN